MTGKTGTGKSSLVNALFGLSDEVEDRAEVSGNFRKPCTSEVNPIKRKVAENNITIWDCPGLQDGTDNQADYLKQMGDKCAQRDLTIYCIKSIETRFPMNADNPDVAAMEKLTKTFGTDFWKSTIITLTFSDVLEAHHPEWKTLSESQKTEKFEEVIQQWGEHIKEILLKVVKVPSDIVKAIPIIPTGHYLNQSLPGNRQWLPWLWIHCFFLSKSAEGKAALVNVNANRKEPIMISDIVQSGALTSAITVLSLSKSAPIALTGLAIGYIVGIASDNEAHKKVLCETAEGLASVLKTINDSPTTRAVVTKTFDIWEQFKSWGKSILSKHKED